MPMPEGGPLFSENWFEVLALMFVTHIVLPIGFPAAAGWGAARWKNRQQERRGLAIGLVMAIPTVPLGIVASWVWVNRTYSDWVWQLGAVSIALLFAAIAGALSLLYVTMPEPKRASQSGIR